jgi:hypothetical protein
VLNSWNPELVGGAEEVVKTLKQVVTKDWRENVSEKVPWRIEYQLLRVTAPIDHVQLLTRLFSPPDPQSIYYGREIARLDEDRFVAWVSD